MAADSLFSFFCDQRSFFFFRRTGLFFPWSVYGQFLASFLFFGAFFLKLSPPRAALHGVWHSHDWSSQGPPVLCTFVPSILHSSPPEEFGLPPLLFPLVNLQLLFLLKRKLFLQPLECKLTPFFPTGAVFSFFFTNGDFVRNVPKFWSLNCHPLRCSLLIFFPPHTLWNADFSNQAGQNFFFLGARVSPLFEADLPPPICSRGPFFLMLPETATCPELPSPFPH